jgi:hypothetical protein
MSRLIIHVGADIERGWTSQAPLTRVGDSRIPNEDNDHMLLRITKLMIHIVSPNARSSALPFIPQR